MSWAAHDMEPYAFQKHLKLKVAFVPLLIGSYSPDLLTKWFVYGIHLGPWDLKATNPAKFHRGWPGFGFTHSFIFGIAIGLIIWKVFGSKLWALSFVIGQFAHSLTDTGDTVGTMLLFPWTYHFHIGAWAYAGQTGRQTDAAAYFMRGSARGRKRIMSKSRREQLEEMLKETPTDAELRYFLAMEYLGAGEHDAALRCFQELLTDSPDYVPTYVQAGQLYNRLDRVQDAKGTFQAGIEAARRKGDLHAAGEMEGFLDAL